MDTPKPALHLADLIDTRLEQPPIMVAFPGSKTFIVRVRPLGNRHEEFTEAAQRLEWDTAHMAKIVKVDQEQYWKLFNAWVIDGWSGLTIEDLRRLILLADPKGWRRITGEVACDEGSKLLLMQHSPSFNAWINRVTRDIERFNHEREAALKKKSSPSPASGSTIRE